MNSNTGQILPQEEMQRLFGEKWEHDEKVKKAGWKPVKIGEAVNLYDCNGLLIGRFTVRKALDRNRLVIKGISTEEYDHLTQTKPPKTGG